ncbi:MAG: DUF177 domain-containing protein [Actinomycetota bacterium]|nr:DUF177 domain-containing protein [Actinomycetota bacterium]
MHPDPRSPMILDTRELSRRPGATMSLQRRIEAPEDFGTEVVSVPTAAPIHLDLRLDSVMEGVLVSGSVTATAIGACVRCLDEVHVPVDVDFQELFVHTDREAHAEELGDDEEDQYELDGDFADLEPVLRDAVVPSLPFQPVCQEDCPGLCSECGAHLRDDPNHHHEMLDPRWAALVDLTGAPADTDEKRN